MIDGLVKPSDNFQYYVPDAIYWNTFDEVVNYMSSSVSGRANLGWIGHVKSRFGAKNTGLFINCGNGWVERDCFRGGLIKTAIGIDIMPQLISLAHAEAEKIGMPANYIVSDINSFNFDSVKVDLAVNVGAMHHIAYIDRVLREIWTALGPDGVYVIGNDYTGPHRNQYAWEAWSETLLLNRELPREYQVELSYPHLQTMLLLDPTEAVHSELQMVTTRRYFDIVEEVQFGGAIAYILLFGNKKLYGDRGTELGRKTIRRILDADQRFFRLHPETNLFTYAVCKPKILPAPQSVLDQWTKEENERESLASSYGGRYYPPTALELIYNELADQKHQISVLLGSRTMSA
jgi:SAM-dependent methyltransferase